MTICQDKHRPITSLAIMRFRKGLIAIAVDIQQMFHRIVPREHSIGRITRNTIHNIRSILLHRLACKKSNHFSDSEGICSLLRVLVMYRNNKKNYNFFYEKFRN